MSGYRLHIDIPIWGGEAEAIEKAKKVLQLLENKELMDSLRIGQVNYRLGHDEDRQKSNYFIKTAAGHVNNKKCRILFSEGLTAAE